MKAKKGLLVREGAALDTPEVTTLDNGLRITCVEEKTVDGKVRLRLTQPVCGWASKKLLDFECGLGKRPTGATPWLRKVAAPEKATKRLVLFNWTGNRGGYGSSHNFKEWPKGLAGFEVWEVAMTGRGARMKEALRTDPGGLFDDLAGALSEALAGGPPCVFLGGNPRSALFSSSPMVMCCNLQLLMLTSHKPHLQQLQCTAAVESRE